jgi:hypothetical protein
MDILKTISKKIISVITGILFIIAAVIILTYLIIVIFLFGRDPVDAVCDIDDFVDRVYDKYINIHTTITGWLS